MEVLALCFRGSIVHSSVSFSESCSVAQSQCGFPGVGVEPCVRVIVDLCICKLKFMNEMKFMSA